MSSYRGAAGIKASPARHQSIRELIRHCIAPCAAAATVLAAGLSPASAQTATPQAWTLEQAVERASLIFEGTVVNIAFRDSDPLPDSDVRVPHTFVTYRVDDVVRGKPESRRMTLRFLGGWASDSGRIMLAAGGPLFSVGDHDILLVTGNGKAICPLVACEMGRFRIEDEQVFTNAGLTVRIDPKGDVHAGPDRLPPEGLTMTFPPAPKARLREVRRQLAEDDLSDAERVTLERRLKDMSAPRVIGVGRIVGELPEPPPEPPLDVATFKRILAAISRQYPTDGNSTVSVSLRDPIPVYAFTPSRPKEPPGPVSPPPSEPRTLEQQLLERNNGNPVLGVQQ